ncbi:ATP-binding cassette-type vacuolar membrane transporter Hmt1 [Blastocladiella emersonii ATCC 22665]|nr:ATP-binding cassette-type vacuolar membrane transporter Hmt1 [Blastocladiella emersonii ATCC 22665]
MHLLAASAAPPTDPSGASSPWAYTARLSPVANAVLCTAPLVVYASYYGSREVWRTLNALARRRRAAARSPRTPGTASGRAASGSNGSSTSYDDADYYDDDADALSDPDSDVGGITPTGDRRPLLGSYPRRSARFPNGTGRLSSTDWRARFAPNSFSTAAPSSDPDTEDERDMFSEVASRAASGSGSDVDDDEAGWSDDEEDDAPLVPPTPPPVWATRAALAATGAMVVLHLATLLAVTLIASPATGQPARAEFPWLVAAHALVATSWLLALGLLYVRRLRWDCTWVVAAFWALALALALANLYDHVMYWANPVPDLDAHYAALTLTPWLLPATVLDVLVPLALSALAFARFHHRSLIDIAAAALADGTGEAGEEESAVRAAALRRQNVRNHGTAPPRRSRSGRHRRLTRSGGGRGDQNAAATAAAVAASLGGASTGRPSEAEIKFKPPKTFADYAAKFRKLAPFVWPQADRYLQFLVVICGFLLLVGRIVNVLLPLQSKALIDLLTATETEGSDPSPQPLRRLPWEPIALFVFLRFLQGNVGLVSTTQDILWIPVGQYTTRAISLKMFQHLHMLSHRFHLTRKTGEILRVQDRGVSSIVSLLSTVLFNIVPTLVDIFIAVIFFATQFDFWFGLIVFVTMFLYIFATVAITEVRTKHRRRSNALENAMQAKAVDSLLNFETVKFYNAEAFEGSQYAKAMAEYQAADWLSSLTTSWLNMTQNVIIQLGLMAGALLCAHRVAVERAMSVGDFVMYLSYITQLYGPLNQFGSYYRQLQKNFVDMEKMLDLLAQVPEVRDPPRPVAIDPDRMHGLVKFEGVSFAYDARLPTLKNISFEVPAGKTVALVGSSGSGKSTMLRLLFRFYDVQGGRITIDGIDIRSMAQRDLRSLVSVVPQDTVLFNDTIRYNIRYGRVSATDAEVEAAARAAQIHDRILSFPDGYDTRVGERGMRLSGGALDSSTETAMLAAIDTCLKRSAGDAQQPPLTAIFIAHRLASISGCDYVVCIEQGRIVEQGTHADLMAIPNGVFRGMVNRQQLAAEEELTKVGLALANGAEETAVDGVEKKE